MADRYATISEIARELRLAPVTVWRKVKDGTIPAIQLGEAHSAWRVDRKGYRDFLAKCAARTDDNSNDDSKHG
jgi:predicted DNA-binding transcriptional regulator AlpA